DLGGYLLIVATDRISAFDSVLPCGIPDKGTVLNQLSHFWFGKTMHIVPNHLVETIRDVSQLDAYRPAGYAYPSYLAGRSMIVKKAERIPVECVVRGYLSGSAWAEYSRTGTIHGQPAPNGLRESERLPLPVFTPTTKAERGHDEPLAIDGLVRLVGQARARELEEKSLSIYRFAERYARARGIIIADTKIEFGLRDSTLLLIDELLTPDSSRFWDARAYEAGRPQPSFDKQPVRDWLETSGWNKEPPAPVLPDELIKEPSQRYGEAYRRLTAGSELRESRGARCI
ncbi:MAG: phosphoribosylaminoimidazolesuccinocarboxamide synthase, partial [Chloroflexi bacterium]|nr:phosphoribosylaminoimidazolesuccinocarboxamide synthase [Chloroflexota bacterium]